MANTYALIQAQTLASTTTTITFSSIPTTYTDLVLKISARSAGATGLDNPNIKFNGDGSTSLYSITTLEGNGSTVTTGRNSSYSSITFNSEGTSYTSNTFALTELYIPSYNLTTNKPISSISTTENNATASYLDAQANLYAGTSGITSIALTGTSGGFVSGSSFYLYGIKNS